MENRFCTRCPRNCRADRNKLQGYCHSQETPVIATVCVHRGEEPPVSGTDGILNVFFTHCNLQCVYCQNKQISDNSIDAGETWPIEKLAGAIEQHLAKGGVSIGFVSPSHYVQQVIETVKTIRQRGYNPVVVYNSNGYDSIESLRSLEPYVDVYLPDFKYSEESLSGRFSGAADYPAVALKAIREMYRQKGNSLIINDRGYAERGIIIRHLVLPGYTENTKGVLRLIVDEISPNIHVSLMSQYNPSFYEGDDAKLRRKITAGEYEDVSRYFTEVGLYKGWIQELESSGHYNPDFERANPFE